jgi:hypothetical protein
LDRNLALTISIESARLKRRNVAATNIEKMFGGNPAPPELGTGLFPWLVAGYEFRGGLI